MLSREVFAANWVEDAEVVYIGKADKLTRRLTTKYGHCR